MEVSIPSRKREETLDDVVESTALERVALAELINASAQEMREVMGLKDVTVDKLIKFQESLDGIIQSGVQVQKLLHVDMGYIKGEDIVKKAIAEGEVIEVDEEIEEEIVDGKKRIKKKITKKQG